MADHEGAFKKLMTSGVHVETKEYFIETAKSIYTAPDMHYHSSYELFYLEKGTREYFIEDRFFSVSEGDFVLIAPSKMHRTGGKYAIRTLIGFSDEFLARIYTPQAIEELLQCFSSMHLTPSEEDLKDLKKILSELADASEETEFAVLLGKLLLKLSKCKTTKTYNEQISRFIEYINQKYTSIQSLEQIADHFYISKYHLCRTFKAAMHMTVFDYLNQVKIKNACHYLKETDKSILEISQLCGFNSSAYFSNIFKKIMKLSPKEYRKKKL